ncbi:Acyl-CoA dehydrogenase [Mycobacterium sp. 012931]|nr:Acyl-CoA dehydrogenase [Mycobacterium sp. 012931]
MALAITAEQEQLAQAVAQFAARHAPIDKTRAAWDSIAAGELPPWWEELTAHGFHAVHLSEDAGGQGGTLGGHGLRARGSRRGVAAGAVVEHRDGKRGRGVGGHIRGSTDSGAGWRRDRDRRAARTLRRARRPGRGRLAP